MHDRIEPFSLEGKIRELDIEFAKQRMEEFLIASMKDDGYIHVIDMDPHWSMKYDFESSDFDFTLTIYGVRVEEAWKYSGIMGGKLIPKYSTKNK